MSQENKKEWKMPVGDVVIPATVRYSKQVCASAKVLYGDIKALSFKLGYCSASNDYFAFLYQVDDKTISEWVNQLYLAGFIKRNVLKSHERHLFPQIGKMKESREKTTNESGKGDECESGKADKIDIIRDSNNNISKTDAIASETPVFNALSFFKDQLKFKGTPLRVIAAYVIHKGLYANISSLKQAETLKGRFMRVASRLRDFEEQKLMTVFNKLDNMEIRGQKVNWTLEAVERYLLNNKL
jgi:hypothetical protein